MIERFRHIRREFGVLPLFKTVLLLVGLLGMTVMGFANGAGVAVSTIVIAGLVLGALLHRPIARMVEYLNVVMRFGLLTYAVVLFVGKRAGLDPMEQLYVITATTVIVFDLQFWGLSDPETVCED